jgi:FlaA1/EpsC-like NDP-sugar epimerase
MLRRLTLAALDVLLVSGAYLLAYWLRLGAEGLPERLPVIAETLPILVVVSLLVHLKAGLYNAILRYASVDTALAVVKAVAASLFLSLVLFFLLFRLEGVPRSVFFIYGMTAFILVGASRFAVRVLLHGKADFADRPGPRVLLLGAGDQGADALRSLREGGRSDAVPAAFLDDDPAKRGAEIAGVRVLGGLDRLADAARSTGATELWVCERAPSGERLRVLFKAAGAAGLALKITHPGAGLPRFEEPRIEDLLSRPPRKLDRDRMRAWIRGRRVLVTGAGGSIGAELCRRVADLEPERLVLCDASEENLFRIDRELRGRPLAPPCLLDVTDAARVSALFEEERPSVVFHAAAYKHVPMLEANPCRGVWNNVQGVRAVALAAREHRAADVVFISTDKAVRPSNVMGATKRLGETLVRSLQREAFQRGGGPKFMAVRFGNVLGSSGSVVPIFQEQIRRGGPVTVTHPDMRRYFMLIPEAVDLVVQAGSIGKGGEVFLLDMGEPVRIVEMAETLIRLMGRPEVRIEFSGVRPGEKIREELLVSDADDRTEFPDLRIDREPPPSRPWAEFSADVDALLRAAEAGDAAATLERLRALVPEYGGPERVATAR